jgi:hypothetical protein
MEEMQRQMQEFVNFVHKEMLARPPVADPSKGAIVPIRRVVPTVPGEKKRR